MAWKGTPPFPGFDRDWTRFAQMSVIEAVAGLAHQREDLESGAFEARLRKSYAEKVSGEKLEHWTADSLRVVRLSFAPEATGESLRAFIGSRKYAGPDAIATFPEVAVRITDEDATMAIRIWMRRPGNHKRGEPNKWVWLVDWMGRLRLTPATRLKDSWRDWKRERIRLVR